MASVCKVHLVGNVGQDPEVRYSAAGKPIANATLATTSRRKDKNGDLIESTEWHRLTFFDKLADIVGQYMKKGALVYVEGTIKYEKYLNKKGVEINSTSIICSEMTILKRPESKPEKYEGLPQLEDDDKIDDQIPF